MDEKTAKICLLKLKMSYLAFLKNKLQERMGKEGWNQIGLPKNHQRLIRLQALKQKALAKLDLLRKKNKPSKIVSHRTEEQRKRDLEKLNESCRKHPEPLLWYLFQCGQITDLTREDFVKINKYVKEELKINPSAELWGINEDEIEEYLSKIAN
ncbi:MAG: hypothetical protein NTV36_02250 [Candidatus Staskawiczbacteria bacterium]|nr:hypothetical protein [Candidatus Staskawiczbacteria bacterium]